MRFVFLLFSACMLVAQTGPVAPPHLDRLSLCCQRMAGFGVTTNGRI